MPLLYAVGDWKRGRTIGPDWSLVLEPTGKAAEDEEPLEVGTKYVRGFYYPGVLSENGKAGHSRAEIMFGDDEGDHPLGTRRKHVPLADFVNLLG